MWDCRLILELFVARYEIGEGLYIGWCSAVLAIAGGACLTCSCRLGSDEKRSVQSIQYSFISKQSIFISLVDNDDHYIDW